MIDQPTAIVTGALFRDWSRNFRPADQRRLSGLLSDDEVRAMFEVNLFRAMRLARSVLPAMRAARRGQPVHASSVSGLIPSPFMGAYGATKHALEGWSKALEHELRPFGIRSFTVRPGFMRTRIAKNAASARHALPDYGPARVQFDVALGEAIGLGEDPAVVAETVSHALAARRRRTGYPAGRAARQLLLLHVLAPKAVFDRSLRKAFSLVD